MKRMAMFLAFFVLGLNILWAQTTQISGTVTSKEDGQALPGATVAIKGTTVGTTTDSNGKYSLAITENQTLIISFVGMKSSEVATAGQKTIDVAMESDNIGLNEVVVVAYGTAKKSSYTGSATQIDSKKFDTRPLSNISKAIEGSSPGVQVSSASGQPGSGMDIRIRGIGSYSAENAPLYIVDGVPYSGNTSNLNPNDIESISILKDAASTALYGNKAANGIVIVTTKRGNKDKSSIQVSLTQGVSSRAIPEYKRVGALEYYPLMWESYYNSQVYSSTVLPATAATNASSKLITNVGYNITNISNDQLVGTDGKLNSDAKILDGYKDDLNWQDQLMRTGSRTDANLTYSGGSDKSDYFVSLGYLDEKGYTINSGLKRYTGRINLNSNPKKWLKTGFNLSGTMTESNSVTSGTTAYINSFYFTRMMGPIYPVHEHDATGAYVIDDLTGERTYDIGSSRPSGASLGRHVIEEILLNDNLYKRNVLGARTYAEILFLKDFKFTVNLSTDLSSYNASTYDNKIVGDGASSGGRASKTNTLTKSYNVNQLLNYNKSIDKHSIEILLGHENYDWNYNYSYGMRTEQISDGNTELINFLTVSSLTSYSEEYKTEGYFSRLNYSFDGKYFLSGSYRRDGSSRFYKANRWGDFWSVSAAWRLDQEQFLKSTPWIDLLKIRASYGEVGNDAGISNYAWQALYSLDNNNANEAGVVQNTLGNKNLTWESNNAYDAAIEFGFLNRITGSLEYYHRASSNLLFDVPVAISSGVTSISRNIGKMYNKGFELRIAVDVVKNLKFRWNIDANASTLKNEFTKLPQDEIINGTKKLKVGHSIYDFWLRDWYGVDPSDGSALYAASSKDMTTQSTNLRVIGTDTVTSSYNNAKYHYAGSAIPDVMGAVTNTFYYKNFELSVLATYQIGGKYYDSNYAALMHSGTYGTALHEDILKRWQKAGDITNVPRLDNSQTSNYGAASDRWLTSASFFAIKSVSFGYNIPRFIAQKAGLQAVKIWASGENLFLKSSRVGLDPQQSFNGTTDYVYSPAKVYTIGINVSL